MTVSSEVTDKRQQFADDSDDGDGTFIFRCKFELAVKIFTVNTYFYTLIEIT